MPREKTAKPKAIRYALPEGVVVVTGATGTLGSALVPVLASHGADALLLVCRSRLEKAKALAGEAQGLGAGRASVIACDLASDDGVEKVAEEAKTFASPVAGLVHLAGRNERAGVEQLSRRVFRRAVEIDLEAPLLLINRLLPMMTNGASIVLTGSRAAAAGIGGILPYSAAKTGLHGALRSLAQEIGGRGIRVNLVEPGLIRGTPGEELRGMEARIPLRRIGRPEEFAGLVLFLLSGASSYITGERIAVSGGL